VLLHCEDLGFFALLLGTEVVVKATTPPPTPREASLEIKLASLLATNAIIAKDKASDKVLSTSSCIILLTLFSAVPYKIVDLEQVLLGVANSGHTKNISLKLIQKNKKIIAQDYIRKMLRSGVSKIVRSRVLSAATQRMALRTVGAVAAPHRFYSSWDMERGMNSDAVAKAWQAEGSLDIQRVTQKAMIHELISQQTNTITTIVPWFLDNMPASYFRQVPEKYRIDHIKAIAAIKGKFMCLFSICKFLCVLLSFIFEGSLPIFIHFAFLLLSL
jgi:hypothetical protein